MANAAQQWLAKIGARMLYITPGSPLDDGCCESFNGLLGDEFRNGEILCALKAPGS